ncbi:hypothetical protein V8E54_004976 [Elaphomyces granulatus]
MGDAAPAFSLSNTEAAQWNRDLMLEFRAALERNPIADLMSMFSNSYRRENRIAQYRQLSYAAKINLKTLDELRGTLKHEPAVNLLSAFSKNYTRMATGPRVVRKDTSEKRGPPEFRTRLDLAGTAKGVFPLSEKVTALLSRYSGGSLGDRSSDAEESLIVYLKQLLWGSPKLWESTVRGVMVKCNEDIVARVITENSDYTEYMSMQYLAERAPDIPAPRPHGLIAFGPFRVVVMSYIPDLTLAEVWPSLSHEEKLSIQRQLDNIRTFRHDDSNVLGGVCGERVKDVRVDECALLKGIAGAMAFGDLPFSARSATYVKLLRPTVKRDPDINGRYVATEIIDWEFSGFYPAYYEYTVLTRTLSVVDEDDWYLYLPGSISPSQFPVRWLVDRIWEIHHWTTKLPCHMKSPGK